ncbi:MAG: glycosyltransferase 87 family protein [Oscillospiraceae bacterium]|nr:glycosyltransferase 87 family protein [Oscillospiraceae bacterium]
MLKNRPERIVLAAAGISLACIIVFALILALPLQRSVSGRAETLPLFIALFVWMCAFAARRLMPKSRKFALAAAGVLALGMAVRLYLLPEVSHDYTTFLENWVQQFRDQGLDGFRNTTANYNAPYLYFLYAISKLPVGDLALIKLFSVAGDAVLVFAGMRLAARGAQTETVPGRTEFFALCAFWLMPTFLLNSAWWAQCDSLYGALCLLSLLYMLENRPVASVLAASLAFAFKLQTIFFLPVFVIFLMARKVKLVHALIFPGVMLITAAPALIFGMTADQTFGVYFGQIGIYSHGLNWNSSSAYGLLPDGFPHDPIFAIGIVAAALFMALLWFLAYRRRKILDEGDFIYLALLMCYGIPWLLPGMHDRYFYLAEVMALTLMFRKPKRWFVALLALIGSYSGYHAYKYLRYLMFPRLRMAVPSAIMGLGFVLAFAALLLDWRKRGKDAGITHAGVKPAASPRK